VLFTTWHRSGGPSSRNVAIGVVSGYRAAQLGVNGLRTETFCSRGYRFSDFDLEVAVRTWWYYSKKKQTSKSSGTSLKALEESAILGYRDVRSSEVWLRCLASTVLAHMCSHNQAFFLRSTTRRPIVNRGCTNSGFFTLFFQVVSSGSRRKSL
jgi:hypothetical protein